MIKRVANSLSCMVIFFGVCIAHAGQIEINTGESKGIVDNSPQNGTGEILLAASNYIHVGDRPSKAVDQMVTVMQLPILADGESITSASVAFNLSSKTAGLMPGVQVDVFFKNVGTVELSDCGTTAVASRVDFVTLTSSLGVCKWSDPALAAAIDGVYSGKTTPSFSHVVFRLRWTGGSYGISDGNSLLDGYGFGGMQNNQSARKRPVLTLVTK